MNTVRSAGSAVEPVVGALRILNGRRLEDAALCTIAQSAPPRAARSRDGERLFVLLDATGPVTSRLYRELRELVTRTYWSSTGSITAALRKTADAANRYLFEANLHSAPSDRHYGGLVCAVLHDEDQFILRAGAAHCCFLNRRILKCFSWDEELAPLGVGRLAAVRLHHAYISPGGKLLLTSTALIRTVDDAGLSQVLARAEMEEVLEGLSQIGAGVDFPAMVVHWPAQGSVAPDVAQPRSRLGGLAGLGSEPPQLGASLAQAERLNELRAPSYRESRYQSPTAGGERPPISSASTSSRLDLFETPSVSTERADRADVARPSEPSPPSFAPPGANESLSLEREHTFPGYTSPRPEAIREPGPSLGEWAGDGLRSVGRGLVAAGGGLAGGARTLFKRMLPGSGRQGRRPSRSSSPPPPRPVPKENRSVMVGLAIGIPLVLIVTVALAYRTYGAGARFDSRVKQAEEEVFLAQAAGGTSEPSRPHWRAALEHAHAAVEMRPDDQVARALQAQSLAALDLLDGVIRLEPVLLKDFGPGTVPRQLVVHGQTVFVLDPAGGWVSRLTLSQTGGRVVEQGDIPRLVTEGNRVGEGTVGRLVDFVWVDLAGGRQASGLVILEEDGALISHDPAWQSEGGTPQLRRSFLGMPPASPQAVGTYEGRFYVLDVAINQIRRYEPRGDTYPDRPEHYFVVPPSRSLADVLDMAIDGYIYLLYNDGTVQKFLSGEAEPFEVSGVPGDLSQAIALTVDPNSSSGAVYVADRGNHRIVALGPDGSFRAQFRAGEAFDLLEALVVDEAIRRFYVLSGGRLYVASLP